MQRSDPRHPGHRPEALQPRRCSFVLASLIAEHNWSHARKPKGVSHATMAARRKFLFNCFEFLRDNPVKSYKLDPRSFSGRHVEFLFRHWEQRARRGELGASSLQKFHSWLSTFAGWINKPNLVKPISAYISDPALYTRSYVAEDCKAWRAQGVDVQACIREVAEHDENAAASLALMAAFGLRFKESVMLRPHVDVMTAEQAGKPPGAVTHYLRTHRGTKGGRLRHVPIDTPERWQAIERARRVAARDEDSVSSSRYTLVQAMRHLRYVMERFGITKRELQVVPHGLRHQYVGDEFRARTGVAPPVEGGPALPRDVDREARLAIVEQVGHSRPAIMNAYLGSSRRREQAS